MYFIGIDGGGTFSRLVALSPQGDIIGTSNGGATNLCSNDYDVVKGNIGALLADFNEQTNTSLADCKGFCIGSAGVDTDKTTKQMEQLLREIGVCCPMKVVNDSYIILTTETKGKAGICVIAGTGSIALAVDESGKAHRAGGFGYLIDDVGSGYYIGKTAICRALMAYDGRGAATMLTDSIKNHFGAADLPDILDTVYSDNFNKTQVAALAVLVCDAAKKGDAVSLEIEQSAAIGLFEHVDALVKRTGLTKHKIVLSGSVLLKNENIKSTFAQLVLGKYGDMEIVPVSQRPEMGAAYAAMTLR